MVPSPALPTHARKSRCKKRSNANRRIGCRVSSPCERGVCPITMRAIMSRPIALQARLIFPVAAPPILDGCVTILDERIVAVGQSSGDSQLVDLGDVAIIPGLVNAHTHLEFSALLAPLGEPGCSLPDWIRKVMAYRRNATATPGENVKRGLHECLHTGTTTVGDIATADWRAEVAVSARTMPEVVMFREAIAPTIERAGRRDCGRRGVSRSALCAAARSTRNQPTRVVYSSSQASSIPWCIWRDGAICRWPCIWRSHAKSWRFFTAEAAHSGSCSKN